MRSDSDASLASDVLVNCCLVHCPQEFHTRLCVTSEHVVGEAACGSWPQNWPLHSTNLIWEAASGGWQPDSANVVREAVSGRCPARVSHKRCPTRVARECPTKVFYKSVFYKSVTQCLAVCFRVRVCVRVRGFPFKNIGAKNRDRSSSNVAS